MNFTEFSQEIWRLTSQDRTNQAFDLMRVTLKKSDLLHEVIAQSGRYKELEKNIRQGTITYADGTKEKSKLRYAILDLLRDIEHEYENNLKIRKDFEEPNNTTGSRIINQTHTGSGDNVGGDKTINQ